MIWNRLSLVSLIVVLLMSAALHCQADPIRLPDGATAVLDTSISLSGNVAYWIPPKQGGFSQSQLESADFKALTNLESMFDGQNRPDQLWIRLEVDGADLSSEQTWLVSWNAFEVEMFFSRRTGGTACAQGYLFQSKSGHLQTLMVLFLFSLFMYIPEQSRRSTSKSLQDKYGYTID